jgi:uncharacterized protein YkwD
MKALRKVLTVLSTTALMVVFVPATTSTASACTHGWAFRSPEKQFASKINQSRLAFGKSKLHLDRELSKAARRHSREMMHSETLYHTPSPTLRNRVTNWVWLGENVGVGSTVDSLHVAFMHSPEHKDNILFSKYRHVGVGTRQRNGRLWVTVLFEAETNPGTPLPMPKC